jgi:hypothetical protein
MDESRAVVHIVVSDNDALVQPVNEYYSKIGGVNVDMAVKKSLVGLRRAWKWRQWEVSTGLWWQHAAEHLKAHFARRL